MKKAWIAPLVLAAVAAGCGGTGAHSKTTKPSHPTTGGTPTTVTTASEPLPDCNAVGINPTGMREGTCTHAGIRWVIVDENHTLRLKTLWANLLGVRTAKTLAGSTGTATASGDFVIASITITNKLAAPQGFDAASTQQAGLILDGAVFKEAVGAESQGDASSCPKVGTSIQPGRSQTCDVIFDVPPHAANDLGKHGSGDLYLVNFGSDLAGSVLPQTIGQVRVYR